MERQKYEVETELETEKLQNAADSELEMEKTKTNAATKGETDRLNHDADAEIETEKPKSETHIAADVNKKLQTM